ncbi:1,6-anhydro-N-acetylmuramyl-L-alanine amidase AmpD [Marinobacter zhejiangensis]|uniref:1,6-anhydro-N-acetylmuramyl-L-alanine amidase AmpD n=1 Tax=Marinobacter zhejiangensis TaxID=488535 RepID=A0A1I4RC75_9GAMM|nr:1,6-anhydro-N-acetylmuramyl-L-alanine amidase AmpD [Marinobacter zhejiangensis]SFM49888.1 AmpD protein [Marinobacter zhejiangensis]
MTSSKRTTSDSPASRVRATGILPDARWCPSPNYGDRPGGTAISLLVVHNISLPPGQFGGDQIERFFCNRLDPSEHPYFETIAGLQVSAHLLIRRDGSVVQFVNLKDRAWHAGRSSFCGQEECNDYSIGIELEGADDVPYAQPQYHALARVASLIMAAWPEITQDRITGHSDIAPGRKTDPGPAFDWEHFRHRLAGH